jgi:hypothetical protein
VAQPVSHSRASISLLRHSVNIISYLVKYILGFVIPCLKSTPPTSSAKPSTYGNGSQPSAKRTQRSKYDTRTYNDLDDHLVEEEEIEMKGANEWGWIKKDDSDARSDEERITHLSGGGITRTVDWSVEMGDRPVTGRGQVQGNNVGERTAVQPANVL